MVIWRHLYQTRRNQSERISQPSYRWNYEDNHIDSRYISICICRFWEIGLPKPVRTRQFNQDGRYPHRRIPDVNWDVRVRADIPNQNLSREHGSSHWNDHHWTIRHCYQLKLSSRERRQHRVFAVSCVG